MLTTFGNVALVCASAIGNLLSQVWDVSNDAMRANDVRGNDACFFLFFFVVVLCDAEGETACAPDGPMMSEVYLFLLSHSIHTCI